MFFCNCNFPVLLTVKVTALWWALSSLYSTANQLDSFGEVGSKLSYKNHWVPTSLRYNTFFFILFEGKKLLCRNFRKHWEDMEFYISNRKCNHPWAKTSSLIEFASSLLINDLGCYYQWESELLVQTILSLFCPILVLVEWKIHVYLLLIASGQTWASQQWLSITNIFHRMASIS